MYAVPSLMTRIPSRAACLQHPLGIDHGDRGDYSEDICMIDAQQEVVVLHDAVAVLAGLS